MWFSAILVLVATSAIYFVVTLYRKRNELAGLPAPPMVSKIWGHLPLAGDCSRLFPSDSHPILWLEYLREKYNMGSFYYLDWWPLGPRWLVIADPEIASKYITTGQSLPKSPYETSFIDQFLGHHNMISSEGEQWKTSRSIFNPGFATNHLMTLAPFLVESSQTFHQKITEKCKNGELFGLEHDVTMLTFDIIGKVILDEDFNSQLKFNPIVETFRERLRLTEINRSGIIEWEKYDPIRKLRFWTNARKLNALVGEAFDRRIEYHATLQRSGKAEPQYGRSAVDLAIRSYQKTQAQEKGQKVLSVDSIDQGFRQDIINQIKTFLFAGHDTTATTISYCFYLLHLHPDTHNKVVAEINQVFGSESTVETMGEAIKSDPYIINKLEYLTAVIKESLRMFPPGSTLRHIPKGSNAKHTFFTDPETGKQYPLEGWHVWIGEIFTGRLESFFPRPTEFIPERFIAELNPFPESKLWTPAGKDAWRPFEKGPRNCIGQELAMVESRIILAMTLKDFDFVPEVNGVKIDKWTPISMAEQFKDGKPGNERREIEGHKIYQILKGTAKPYLAMPGRMRPRKVKD